MAMPEYDVSYHWTKPALGSGPTRTGWATVGHAFVNPKGRIKVCFHANPVPGMATTPGEFVLFPKMPEETIQERATAQEPPE